MDLAGAGTDLRPLFELLVEHHAERHDTSPITRSASVTNLSANDYVGRMAVGRIWNGKDQVWRADRDSSRTRQRNDRSIEPGGPSPWPAP